LSMVTMALAWCLRQDNLASVIIGASRPEQVHQDAEAAGVKLGEDTLEAIDAALEGVTVTGPQLANFVKEGVTHR
jgi:aryl-alcohol dehydrogenase-like predicted oxidoreductase